VRGRVKMKRILVVFLALYVLMASGSASAIDFGGSCFNDMDCPADTECHNSYCDIASGTCKNVALTGIACGDGGTCSNGVCIVSGDCDDNNVCTQDSGNAAAFCFHEQIDCSDDDASTYDWCLRDSGCQNTIMPACADNDPCTITQYMSNECMVTDYSSYCDDGNPETADSCDLTSPDPSEWYCINTPIDPSVPEFGALAVLAAGLGGLAILVTRRH
jgi:hypothetical protein